MSARITVVLRYDDFSALSDTAVESELLGILRRTGRFGGPPDRKSTRLNSSHTASSYAVFCLKKKPMQH